MGGKWFYAKGSVNILKPEHSHTSRGRKASVDNGEKQRETKAIYVPRDQIRVSFVNSHKFTFYSIQCEAAGWFYPRGNDDEICALKQTFWMLWVRIAKKLWWYLRRNLMVAKTVVAVELMRYIAGSWPTRIHWIDYKGGGERETKCWERAQGCMLLPSTEMMY